MPTHSDRGYTFVEILIAAGVVSLVAAVVLLITDPFTNVVAPSGRAVPIEA